MKITFIEKILFKNDKLYFETIKNIKLENIIKSDPEPKKYIHPDFYSLIKIKEKLNLEIEGYRESGGWDYGSSWDRYYVKLGEFEFSYIKSWFIARRFLKIAVPYYKNLKKLKKK